MQRGQLAGPASATAEPVLGDELLKSEWRASMEELAPNEMPSQFAE